MGIAVLGIGLRRWSGGDHRPVDSWLAASIIVGAGFWIRDTIRRCRLALGRRHLAHDLSVRSAEIRKTSVYRPPPDPRRTRRQRFIDLFSNDLDRSNEPPPQTRAGRIAKAVGAMLGRLSAVGVPLFPLVLLLRGFPALYLICVGSYWTAQCLRQLVRRARAPRRLER